MVALLFSIYVLLESVCSYFYEHNFGRSDPSIGRIGIVDHDVVELSNLQRQVLHSEETVGIPKVESAAQSLKRYFTMSRPFEHPTN